MVIAMSEAQPQECPAEDCTATFAAVALEATGRLCPECGEPVIECPACETIVLIDYIWRWGACPACLVPRVDLAALDRGEDIPEMPAA